MKVSYIGIATPNLPQLAAFYKNVLGFAVKTTMGDVAVEMEKSGIGFVLFSNDAMIEASGYEDFRAIRKTSSLVLSLEVDSAEEVDQEYSSFISKGAIAIKEPEDKQWGQRTAFLRI